MKISIEEIIIEAEAKEIAALLQSLAGRQSGEDIKNGTLTELAEGLKKHADRVSAHILEEL